MDYLDKIKKEIKSEQAVLLDIREKDEWNEGHLKDAIFVPLSDIQAGIFPENLNQHQKTYIHCRSGKRVLTAQPLLEAEGFNDVIALDEGFIDLANHGFETA